MLPLGLPLIVISATIAMPIGSFILRNATPGQYKRFLVLGCLIGLIGITLSLFATSFEAFTLIFSVSYGVANGFTYTIPLKVCWEYYPERKGMVSGFVICGFGLGAAIFSIVSTQIVNPSNQKVELF